jgi:hypothetical protein
LFITAPGLVQHLHPSEVAPPQSHWPAITLSMERPWYLLTYDVAFKGQKVSQTALVASDATLLELLDQIPRADVTGIARVDRCGKPGPCWAFQWLEGVWASSRCEAQAVGALLFRFHEDPQMRDTRLLPVPDEPGRRLLHVASHLLARVP